MTFLVHRAARIVNHRYRRRVLYGWLWLAIVELALFSTQMERPSLRVWCLEIFGLVTIGVVHAWFAPNDWRGSAAWPGALYATLSAFRFAAELVALGFGTMNIAMPFVGLGALVIAVAAVRLLHPVWRRLPVSLLAFGGPLVVWVVLAGPQTLRDWQRLPRATANGPPIVVVTIDTLRSDAATTMDTWSFLRERGAVWERAMSASSWTWPALVSLWSGVDAAVHGSGRRHTVHQKMREWPTDLPMLPRELATAGYRTVAFTTNPLVALMPLEPLFQLWHHGNAVGLPLLLSGFVGTSSDAGDAADVIDGALDWLATDAPSRGFLLWVHLYEPHLPYRHRSGDAYDYNLLRNARLGDWFIDAPERDRVRDAYGAEVAYADHQVMRLFTALDHRGFFRDGVLAFGSDHGEEFWEHGGFEHGHSHHGEVVDVPLALIAPGVAAGVRTDLASLVDVAPTLRAIAGLPHAGVDLRQPIPSDRVARAFGNLYYRPMRSLRLGTQRIIIDADRITAFDLSADPAEQHGEALSAAALRERVGAANATAATSSGTGREVDLAAEAVRALGYVH